MTARNEIREWLNRGKEQNATHMIVACDTWDHCDYPVYVQQGQDAKKMTGNLGSMQTLMEVYSYALPLQPQLDEHRAVHYD